MTIECIRDVQDILRQVVRCLNQDDGRALEVLTQMPLMQQKVDRVVDGLVSRASFQGSPWKLIGKALNKTADTVRKHYASNKIANRMGLHLPRRRRGEATTDAEGFPGANTVQSSVSSHEASGAAFNRLAPLLSSMARHSQLPQQAVADRAGCSASFLSRVLKGDRLPLWSLTERLTIALDGEVSRIRAAWESEKLREKSPSPTLLPAAKDSNKLYVLQTAMRILYIRSGITRLDSETLTPMWRAVEGRYASFMSSRSVPPWDDVKFLTQALSGDLEKFTALWNNAEAAERNSRMRANTPSSTSKARSRTRHRTPEWTSMDEVSYFVQTLHRQLAPYLPRRCRRPVPHPRQREDLMGSRPTTPTNQPRWKQTARRYGRAALRNAVNGAGYATGAGIVGLLFWWMQR